MDKIDIEIIRLLVRDKGGVMERRSLKSICKTLEARPTVRAKRLVQHGQLAMPGICPDCNHYLLSCTRPGVLQCDDFKSALQA